MSNWQESKQEIESLVRVRLVRLKSTLAGLVVGIMCALGVFIATNWLVLKGGERVGPHLQLLSQYFIGYRVTFLGSFVGAAYAFFVGFVGAYAVARMYNWIASMRDKG